MPVIKSAIKKLRHDKKKGKENNLFSISVEKAVKDAVKTPGQKTASLAFSLIDKAVKKNLIHKNKGARMKSKISYLLPKKTTTKAVVSEKKPISKTVQKTKTTKKSPK